MPAMAQDYGFHRVGDVLCSRSGQDVYAPLGDGARYEQLRESVECLTAALAHLADENIALSRRRLLAKKIGADQSNDLTEEQAMAVLDAVGVS